MGGWVVFPRALLMSIIWLQTRTFGALSFSSVMRLEVGMLYASENETGSSDGDISPDVFCCQTEARFLIT